MLPDEDIINIIPKTKIFINYFLTILSVIIFIQFIGIILSQLII
jgi:hypothetical protein